VDFAEMPPKLLRCLPRRNPPLALLAWLGIRQGDKGLGHRRRLLAQALRDCYEAGQTFPFIAVILDCIDDKALTFCRHWDFRPLPGDTYRFFLS
jgi:hypothetical protein